MLKKAWKTCNHLPRRPWFTLVLLALTALLYTEFSLSLDVWEELSWGGGAALFFLNLLPALLALLVLWLAFGQAWLSVLVVGVLCFLITGGNYFLLSFRNTPLQWADIFRIREGTMMAGQFNVRFTPVMWIWIAFIAALTVLLFLLGRGNPGALVRLLGLTASGLGLLICFYNICPDRELYADLAGDHAGSKNEAYVTCGVLYPFLHSAGDYYGVQWSYNKAEAQRIMSGFSDGEIPAEKKVHLVGLQLEAFADFTDKGVEGLSPETYEQFHALQEKSYCGNLITDIFGGGTAETEWAVLTGGNVHDDFKVKTDSVVWYLKGQGYTANGGHPCRDWFYDRKHVNPNLGLDDYLFTDNYYYQFVEKNADVAYDVIFFPDLQERLEEHFRTTDDPLFSFNVTYQGHGPYETEFRYWSESFFDGPYSEACLNALNNYFWVINDTQSHLMELVDFLSREEEPVVLFLYGDHMPWLGDGAAFYKELKLNLDTTTEEGFRNYYTTPYLIWANDAAKETLGFDFIGEGPDLSPCFFMDHLFRLMGWQGSDYMQAQREVTDALNVLHTTGWLEEAGGELTTEDDPKTQSLREQFENLSTWDRHRYDSEGAVQPSR